MSSLPDIVLPEDTLSAAFGLGRQMAELLRSSPVTHPIEAPFNDPDLNYVWEQGLSSYFFDQGKIHAGQGLTVCPYANSRYPIIEQSWKEGHRAWSIAQLQQGSQRLLRTDRNLVSKQKPTHKYAFWYKDGF